MVSLVLPVRKQACEQAELLYRHASFYCASLYRALQVLGFYKLKAKSSVIIKYQLYYDTNLFIVAWN